MRKISVLESSNRYAQFNLLEVELTEDQVSLLVPQEFSFRIDNVEAATKLRDILNVYLAIQELDEE